MKIRKLVCGVGINDADYAVQKWEEVGHVDGKKEEEINLGMFFLQSLDEYAYAMLFY